MPIGVQAAQDVVLRVGAAQAPEEVQKIGPQQWLTAGKDHFSGPYGANLWPQTGEVRCGHLVW
jgi:hypothetical protein